VFDKGKIVGGLAIFLCLATFPVWYLIATGKADYHPNPVLPASENQCIESKEYMRQYHMQLLQQWRDSAVRSNLQVYVSSDNKTYDISLTGTCLNCHSNKTEFCDTCHNYSAVSPNCWECHNVPTNTIQQVTK